MTDTEVQEEVAAPVPAKSSARKVILIAVAVLFVLYAYEVVADRVTPYTSQASVDTFLVQVAPQVTGQVVSVGVVDNGSVKKGQVMFRIDPQPFEIAVSKAQADLSVALQASQVSSVEINVAQAALLKQKEDLAASRTLGRIVTNLVDKRALAETNAIRARADTAKTQASVAQADAEVERAKRNAGPSGAANPKVRQALAALQQAQLDLKNTTIVAPSDGVVTNLRLAPGQYVSTGQPLLSFIEGGPRWISASMRENQLGNITPGNEVLVALDDTPGRVFKGRVESIGWGVTQGDEAPTGQLEDVQPAAGWLREPRRFNVRVVLIPEDEDKSSLDAGRSGAQANVIAFTDPYSIINPIGRLWIRVIALFSYLR